MSCYSVELGQTCKHGEISVSTGGDLRERSCCAGETPINKILPGVSQLFPIGNADACTKPKGGKCPEGTTFAMDPGGGGNARACCNNFLAVNTPASQMLH